MDLIETRFQTFKQFVEGIKGVDDQYIQAIKLCPLLLFLKGLDDLKHLTIDEVIVHISEKAKFDLNNTDVKDVERFKLYIVYFRELNETLGL
jgi:hypothetical protein